MTSPIPQADPRAAYLAQQIEIDAAVARVLANGRYILGPEVDAFEQAFAEWNGVHFAMGVASGTDAIALGLRALGIGPGDAVATVSLTASATAAAIELAGATPVLVDIEASSFNMDPEALERLLRAAPRPIRAIVPVHLYGRPARIGEIRALGQRWGAVVVEDCAQAHGAVAEGRLVGGFGEVGAFSFYPTKNLGALGDGGMLVTDDAEVAARARSLREYGWRRRFVSEAAGMNTRLDEIQAAVLRVKLQRLNEANARRRAIAHAYAEGLAGLPLTLPQLGGQGEIHVWHQYVVRAQERDRLRQALSERGVMTAVHYPEPVHRQPAYAGRLEIGPGGLPVTDALAAEILSLPIYPELTDECVARVVGATRAVLA